VIGAAIRTVWAMIVERSLWCERGQQFRLRMRQRSRSPLASGGDSRVLREQCRSVIRELSARLANPLRTQKKTLRGRRRLDLLAGFSTPRSCPCYNLHG